MPWSSVYHASVSRPEILSSPISHSHYCPSGIWKAPCSAVSQQRKHLFLVRLRGLLSCCGRQITSGVDCWYLKRHLTSVTALSHLILWALSMWSLWLLDYSCHGFFSLDHSYIMLLVAGCCEKWIHTHIHAHTQFVSVNVANHPHILVLPRREQPEDKQQLLSHHLALSCIHHILSLYYSLIPSLAPSLCILCPSFSLIATILSPPVPQFFFNPFYLSAVIAVSIFARSLLSYLHIS